MDQPTIVKKGRGVNLIHRGYRYSKDKKSQTGVQYWKCTTRNCSGRAHTTDTDQLLVIKLQPHDHEPDQEAANAAKIKADLCERAAQNPTVPMKEIYNQYLGSADAPPAEDDLLEPQLRSCRSQMYRARRKNLPQLPATRSDIELEGQWATTNDNQRFLLHKDDDMIVLATDDNLEKLASAETVFMDGTFRVAPRQFTQLFSLHIIYLGFFIPVLYALLKDKSRDTYYSLFATVRRKMAEQDLILNPPTLMLDFESGVLPTLRQHFPNATVKGCNFHFTQAIWRRVQLLGLVTHYEDSVVRRIVRSLMGLAFVPRLIVRQTFTTIKAMNTTDLPAVEQLLDYFESTWINGTFPVSMWNMYKQELRTNNKVEGWHNSLNQAVRKSHPNIYELLTTLKEEQAATDRTKHVALLGTQPPPMKKKYRERNQAIKDLQESFERGERNIKEYLSGIRRHVGFRR